MAKEARKTRKGMMMSRTARKKVNIGTRIRIQRISLALEKSNTKETKENRRTSQREQFALVKPQSQSALASSLDLASIRTLVRSPHLDHEGWLRWTYETGAAISAFPLDARVGTETQANDCSYKTASGELMSDRGGLRVQGTTECGS